MSAEQYTPTRVFRLGSMELADPDPNLSPEEAVRLYEPNHKVIAHSTLSEPQMENGKLVYELEKPAVKTKG